MFLLSEQCIDWHGPPLLLRISSDMVYFLPLFFSFIDYDIKAVFMFHQDQKGFPDGLFAVKMYALTTEAPKKVHRTRSKTQSNRPRKIM